MFSSVPDTGKDTVFGDCVFAFESAEKETAAPEVKTRFHFTCEGLPGLCDLVVGADVNPKCANGISVEWDVGGGWIWRRWVFGVCRGGSDAV